MGVRTDPAAPDCGRQVGLIRFSVPIDLRAAHDCEIGPKTVRFVTRAIPNAA